MKQSKIYIPTLKEVPSNAEIQSHKLLLKAGYIHQNAAGIYTYLPMATKVLNKIETIIREELDFIGANEIKMPFLQPSDLWEASGRWANYGAELFRVEDRHERSFALAPTHEEVATDVVKNYLNSYKKFPMNIYQIQTKMRDEKRPRFGLLRGREFIMMDGYTFDRNDEELKDSYDAYYGAYKRIFKRLGLDYKIVGADNGSMGGMYSHEFMAISEIGEDFIAYEEGTDIAYNVEAAPIYNVYEMDKEEALNSELIHTPNFKTINDLKEHELIDESKLLKAVCYNVDSKLVIAFVMGNQEVEETKVAKIFNAQSEIEIADEKLLTSFNLIPGFIGPLDLPSGVEVVFDKEIKFKKNLISGANKKDYHIKNVNLEGVEYFDIKKAKKGDLIREGGNPIDIKKGIEIGHIFALGKKYTKGLGVNFLNEEQKTEIPTMGSYGIGVSRLLSTIIEQNNDEDGIILPDVISPYKVHIIALDYEKQKDEIEKLTKDLDKKGLTYLLDDRKQRPGIKFKDADLIGIPKQVVIGKKFVEGLVEVKNRKDEEKKEIKVEDIISFVIGE